MKEALAVAAVLGISLPFTLAAEQAVACPDAPSTYQNRKVEKVSITSPVYYFSAAKSGLAELAQGLPLRTGDRFDVVKYSIGAGQITTTIRTTFVDGFSAMRFVVTAPRLENCTADTVEVHYIVYPKNGSRPHVLNREKVMIVQHEQGRAGRSGSPAG